MKTYQTETIGKLSDALAKAQAEMQHAAKSAENPFYKSKYADLPAVIDAARPHLAKHGLSVTQITDFDESGVSLITQINHSSGEWQRGYYPIRPVKNDPQGMGSALTYARRYSYQSIVGIATAADDDDGNAGSNVEKDARSVFKNASLRNNYCDNVIKSYETSETIDQLNEVVSLNKTKFDEMRNSGNDHDELAIDELHKRYKLRLMSLKEKEEQDKMVTDSLGHHA